MTIGGIADLENFLRIFNNKEKVKYSDAKFRRIKNGTKLQPSAIGIFLPFYYETSAIHLG